MIFHNLIFFLFESGLNKFEFVDELILLTDMSLDGLISYVIMYIVFLFPISIHGIYRSRTRSLPETFLAQTFF